MHSIIIAIVCLVIGAGCGYAFRGGEAKIAADIHAELSNFLAELKKASADVKSKL